MWNLIRSRKVLITADHYNSLMASYIENGIDFEPEEFFKQLRYNNLYPNRLVDNDYFCIKTKLS